MKNYSRQNATRVAVPYYGSLSQLPSRLTRIFFLVQVDLVTRSITDLSLEVWEPEKEPRFPAWLKQMGAEGLFCSDTCGRHKAALDAEGIWVQSQQDGDVHEVIQRWLLSLPSRGSMGQRGETSPVRAIGSRRPVLSLAKREGVRYGGSRTKPAAEPASPQQRATGTSLCFRYWSEHTV